MKKFTNIGSLCSSYCRNGGGPLSSEMRCIFTSSAFTDSKPCGSHSGIISLFLVKFINKVVINILLNFSKENRHLHA